MVDVVSAEKRSAMMSNIRSKNTRPEVCVRQHLHSLGYRYRLGTKIFGFRPDIVLSKYPTVFRLIWSPLTCRTNAVSVFYSAHYHQGTNIGYIDKFQSFSPLHIAHTLRFYMYMNNGNLFFRFSCMQHVHLSPCW